jgi:hypothetical protein
MKKRPFRPQSFQPKDPILYLSISKTTGQIETNYQKWYEWWSQTKIGTYGEKYKEQFDNKLAQEIDFAAEMQALNLEVEQDTGKDVFPLSVAQRTMILNQPAEMQAWAERDLYIAWSNHK